MQRLRSLLVAPLCSLLLCLLLLSVLACSDEPEAEPLEVDVATTRALVQGPVVGYVGSHGSHAWRGIPFAKPPQGELRWRAPRPPAPWIGTREALAQSAACPQFASPFGGANGEKAGAPTGSED